MYAKDYKKKGQDGSAVVKNIAPLVTDGTIQNICDVEYKKEDMCGRVGFASDALSKKGK